MKKNKKYWILIIIFLFELFFFGCGRKLPVETDLSQLHFKMMNQDSILVVFPDYLKGKPAILGMIFTNCPDVCPLITNNMQRIQKRLMKTGIKEINFVSITFDPMRDKPSVLKDFAELREIETSHWQFLTGEQSDIDSLRRRLKYLAIAGDSTKTADGKLSYFFVHTDRIYLIDQDARVRKYYKGSEVNLDEIAADIKLLYK
ncbi:MAG: SCO family protein [Ignavibacteriales bacterium]|nr:SCO family protein [Ignavibacteriales bacterium]